MTCIVISQAHILILISLLLSDKSSITWFLSFETALIISSSVPSTVRIIPSLSTYIYNRVWPTLTNLRHYFNSCMKPAGDLQCLLQLWLTKLYCTGLGQFCNLCSAFSLVFICRVKPGRLLQIYWLPQHVKLFPVIMNTRLGRTYLHT